MVLTASFVLLVTGLFCHRHLRIKVLSKPGRADLTSANLTPASGRQDHTTSPYAAASFVRTLVARLTLPRPPHPAPYVRDDREAPLLWERDDGSCRDDLGRLKTKIFLQAGLDRLMGDLPVGHIRATWGREATKPFAANSTSGCATCRVASADSRRVSGFRSLVLNVGAQSVIATAVWRAVVV
jgi:hypothetical protein